MPKQNDGMEKLVEEIGELLVQSVAVLVAPATDEEYRRVNRVIAERLIARIGKAYADEELELPREVGRGRLHAHGIYEDVDWDDGRHGKVRNEDHRFIALGKEEDK